MKSITSLLLSFFFLNGLLPAQNGCEIQVVLQGYTYDTLWFGHSLGKRAVPEFFGLKQQDGSYLLKTESPMPPGMYAIIHKRSPNANPQFFQCWLAEGQRKFSLTTHITQPYENPVIVGSAENEALYRYLRQWAAMDKRLDDAIDRWRYLQTEETWRNRTKTEVDMRQMQDNFVKSCPGTLTAKLVAETSLPLPPPMQKPTTWQQEADERWRWQRAHYFDKTDIGTEAFLRYPQWMERTDFYLFRLPPPHPDTTVSLIDEVFRRLETYPEGYEYYQKYITNSLAKMSQYRLDEVFVYVARKYVEGGKAAWAKPGDVSSIANEASQMEPLFVGRPAPNITLFDTLGQPVRLYDVEANLTLVIFWLPDCSHCQQEIPLIAKIYERYKNKGLKVMAVCGKSNEATPMCWEFTDSQHLPADWLLLADPQRRSNMVPLFNVKSYPRIFLLDKDKNIVFKRSGDMPEWQFDAVLGRY
ncbi:MAG: redoxin domain-containing protein [Bacteroidetes bacterium]|nr:redoxin domain-containing protein [Bacteroidota bacterium]